VALLVCTIVVNFGIVSNQYNHKYSRSTGTSCNQSILVLNAENSHMCCSSDLYSKTWVCLASFDRLNKVLSSNWAFVIPLVPYLLNVLIDKNEKLSVHLKRGSIYIAIFAIRTVCYLDTVIS
jgi:hypothetical protein